MCLIFKKINTNHIFTRYELPIGKNFKQFIMSKETKTSKTLEKETSSLNVIFNSLTTWPLIFLLFIFSIMVNQYFLYKLDWSIIQNFVPKFMEDGKLSIPTFGLFQTNKITLIWSIHNYPYFFVLIGYLFVWFSRYPVTQYSLLFGMDNNVLLF